MKSRIMERWLEVPTTDPEETRRRKLLGILLTGVTTLTFVILFGLVITHFLDLIPQDTYSRLGLAVFALFTGFLITFLINRYSAGWLAAVIFLSLLVTIFAFADEPRQVVEGRTLFLFTIPILMSSVILRPWASFITAGVCGMIIAYIDAVILHNVPGIPTILGFFTVAFVSWLSARSLETALVEVRAFNLELEDRVHLRTNELQQANGQLTLAYEKLQELDRLKSRFLSIVSHELRTPLSAILGFGEMLQAEVYGPLSQKQRGALERILANDERMLNLVNDLLDQARMEAGQLSLKIEPFTLQDLIDDMESTMRVLIESKKLYLKVHISPVVPITLQGDRKRLHQILVNLINNALKFTQKGGVNVHFYCPDEDHWAVDVVDTGPGISQEIQSSLFEPFRQGDSSTTREHTGFGLGLSIVKQLATLMGGSVSLISEVGAGSTFTVKIPIVPPQTNTNQRKAGGIA
ncbi:MAG: HAMP domain-containing histidine kinase [Anaerolineae bacterium]|nr:HAMP domain-containing histidine kinase [Anaerolineae bacterium]